MVVEEFRNNKIGTDNIVIDGKNYLSFDDIDLLMDLNKNFYDSQKNYKLLNNDTLIKKIESYIKNGKLNNDYKFLIDFIKQINMKENVIKKGDFIKLVESELGEATTTDSTGSYETPKAWAKSMSKKDWRHQSKTTFPGGKFVKVKEKCKKFPYCNQGDINALELWEDEELVKESIKELSKEMNISENLIRSIIYGN